MDRGGDVATLVKLAGWGFAISLVASIMISVILVPGGDYNFDEITNAREDLISFSGESMINQNPWQLVGVYTPWIPGTSIEDHVDPDGFLYGSSVQYSEIGKTTNIALDPTQKSAVPINIGDYTATYEVVTGLKWWANSGIFTPITSFIGEKILGRDPTIVEDRVASTWAYTGYRYVFDPMLPFSSESEGKVSSVDGSLSIVWYSYNSQEGISGALQIYGGDVLLSSLNATDIIAAYNTASGYASVYDFVFDGVNLTLSIRFDQNVLDSGTPLMQAFTAGDWTMAISAVSAGNFLDIENSASYAMTAGSVAKTFSQIFTFNTPSIDNFWMDLILWLIVGLPFSVAMLCASLWVVHAFKIW